MEQTSKIEFKKVRDFGEIINVTFEFIRQNFKGLGLSLLLIAGPAAILSGIAQGYNNVNLLNGEVGNIFGRFIVTVPLLILLSVLVLAVVYGYINLYLNSEKSEFSVEEVWNEAKKNLGMMSLTVIAGGIIMIITTLMLIIPGIYFIVVLNLIFIVRIREKRTFFDSVSRCMDLISGHWWFTFGLLIVTSVIIYIFSFILSLPQTILVFLTAFGLDPQSHMLSNLFAVFASILSAFGHLFYGIFYIAMAFQYYSIVEKKEAVGLMEKINNITETN